MKEKLKAVRVELAFLVLTGAFLGGLFLLSGRDEGDVFSGFSVETQPPRFERVEEAAPTVNINTASVEELETLPEVGSKLAEEIFLWRREHGPFSQKEDLLLVEGVTERIYGKILNDITVGDEVS